MIEFRQHRISPWGFVSQYRTWVVDVCPVDGTMRVNTVFINETEKSVPCWCIEWTGWQDVPTTQEEPPLTIDVIVDAKAQKELDVKIKAQNDYWDRQG